MSLICQGPATTRLRVSIDIAGHCLSDTVWGMFSAQGRGRFVVLGLQSLLGFLGPWWFRFGVELGLV